MICCKRAEKILSRWPSQHLSKTNAKMIMFFEAEKKQHKKKYFFSLFIFYNCKIRFTHENKYKMLSKIWKRAERENEGKKIILICKRKNAYEIITNATKKREGEQAKNIQFNCLHMCILKMEIIGTKKSHQQKKNKQINHMEDKTIKKNQ